MRAKENKTELLVRVEIEFHVHQVTVLKVKICRQAVLFTYKAKIVAPVCLRV